MEGLCGAYIQDSTTFPSGVNRGASFDPELEQQIGEIVSRQEAAYGITQILAPVLDISRESRMGRQSEPYGEDPTLAATMGTAFTKGIQETGAAGRNPESVAKHFLGFHKSEGGIHGAYVDIGDRLLSEVYGKPFQAAIKKSNLRGIMPCYCSIDGLPIHASQKYLTGLLRKEMGFDGVVVSDYCGAENVHEVQKTDETKGTAGWRCLRAGEHHPVEKQWRTALVRQGKDRRCHRPPWEQCPVLFRRLHPSCSPQPVGFVDPGKIKALSECTGIHVVCGTGYYIDAAIGRKDRKPGVAGMQRKIGIRKVRIGDTDRLNLNSTLSKFVFAVIIENKEILGSAEIICENPADYGLLKDFLEQK